MSEISQNTSDNQEIDLSQISSLTKIYLIKLRCYPARIFFLIKKRILLFTIMILIGVFVGLFLDSSNKYKSKIIVTPNYGTTEYLYSNIELLNSRGLNKEIKFGNNLLSLKSISDIKVEPIIDVYRLVNENDKNLELIKLMAEDDKMDVILKNDVTSRNYKQHTIIIESYKPLSKSKDIEPILQYLNYNKYYENLKKSVLENTKSRLVYNEKMIGQIDSIIRKFSNKSEYINDKLVYNNENLGLNDLMNLKDRLIIDLGNRKIELYNFDKIIKDNSLVLNIKVKKSFLERKAIISPIIVFLLFIIYGIFFTYNEKKI
jgi:hypothetical protein